MFVLAYLAVLAIAVTSALPTPQIVGPAATLAAIPATNHILILTPQAQVQLEPTLKYSQPLVQHLAPVARIDSPADQTVLYYPNDNLMHVYHTAGQKGKQLESTNLTNIVNQFVSAGQTAQAQLEAFQQQLSQGLENLIQPVGGQKTESESNAEMNSMKLTAGADQVAETSRRDGGRFYSIPKISKFYNNFEVIHTPLNPLFTVQPYQSIRARSVAYPDEKILINTALKSAEGDNLSKIHVHSNNPKPKENARSVEAAGASADQLYSGPVKHEAHKVTEEHKSFGESPSIGKYIGVSEQNAASEETQPELKKGDQNIALKEGQPIEQSSFAEPYPAGLNDQNNLSQAKPIESEIASKAPSVSTLSDEKLNTKSS